MSGDRYAPKLGRLTVQRRDPIVSCEVRWEYGPNFGDSSTMRVARVGETVTVTERGKEVLSMLLDRAHLVLGALRDVIEWSDDEVQGDEQ